MTKQLLCSCGYLACGEDGDDLLSDVEAHIASAHADLLTGDRVAQLDDEAAPEPALPSCAVEAIT